jgi:hypothetical protein
MAGELIFLVQIPLYMGIVRKVNSRAREQLDLTYPLQNIVDD